MTDLPYVDLGELGRRALADATPEVRRALLAGTCDLVLHVDMSRVPPTVETLDRLIATDADARARYEQLLDEWARRLTFRPLRRFGLVAPLPPGPWKAARARRYRRRR